MKFRQAVFLILCVLATSIRAQNYVVINGSITDDADGETLPNATVSFRGHRSYSTLADANGHYSLKIVAGESYALIVCRLQYISA